MNKIDKVKKILIDKPLKLDCGQTISNFPLAYETYGTLNDKKDNAILAFHALTGDQFASGTNPITGKEGWWNYAVGPGKAIDTEKYFVICANVIGGCMGSFGPSHENPKTKKIYGTDFPVITINDMVNAQINLLDFFGIKKLFSVVGGSMGGMQVLQFISNYPDKAKQQYQLLVLQAILRKILLLMNLADKPLRQIIIGLMEIIIQKILYPIKD